MLVYQKEVRAKNNVSSWLKRKRLKGIEPNADEVWFRILFRENLDADAGERVFEAIK